MCEKGMDLWTFRSPKSDLELFSSPVSYSLNEKSNKALRNFALSEGPREIKSYEGLFLNESQGLEIKTATLSYPDPRGRDEL